MKRHAIVLFVAISALAAVFSQAPSPPPPAKYQAVLRYQIIAPRDQHVVLYDRLIRELQGLQFEFQPPLEEHPETDRIDPSKNILRGLVPSANVARLRALPHVAGLVLVPEGMKLPEEPDAAVRVRVELTGGLLADRQRDLAQQTTLLLKELGFKEAPGHDHRGAGARPYTRLQGTLPAGQLEVLLKDLRTQPGGWFASRIASDVLPAPLQQVNPIRYVEVLPDPEPIKDAAPPAARAPAYLDKIGPGLWELLEAKGKEEDKAAAGELVRVQIIFAGTRSEAALRSIVQQAAPGGFVEGVLGSQVSAEVQLAHVKALAALADVIAVRFPPPPAGDEADLPADFEPDKALAQSGLAALHGRDQRGQGVRLAIVDTDFRGWRALVKQKKLPAATRIVDLTAEHTTELTPRPPLPGDEIGHGTQLARIAALAAPAAELVLVRLDSTDHYQIAQVDRYIRGGLTSPSLERRLDEMRVQDNLLLLLRNRLLKEREAILESFRDETDLYFDFGFLGPVYGWIFSERDWHRQRQVHHEQRERDHAARERRYWKLVEEVQSLKGIPLVVMPFAWNEAYPLGGASPLSRAFEPSRGMSEANPTGPCTALWFVPTGNSAGQSWHGMLRDADQNGVMEFTAPAAPLPAGSWSPELNFLAWQPHAGKTTATLPDKARLRLTMQWREPHDPDYFLRPGEDDFYRKPLAELRLTLLRQRDPAGKTVGADAFEVVARSRFVPDRLEHLPGGTVYEQVLEWAVEQPGRYAVQIEHTPAAQWVLVNDKGVFRFLRLDDLAATGIRPLGTATLPAVERSWELQPRLFVDAVGPETRGQGRPVLADFTSAAGSIGVPADARGVIAVGAAGFDDKPRPYSVAGSPAAALLADRPALYAYDALREGKGGPWGTTVSTAFAAGTAAAVLSSGANANQLCELISRQQGRVFRVVAPSAQKGPR